MIWHIHLLHIFHRFIAYINSWFMCSKQIFIPWRKHIDIKSIICCIQRVDYIYRDIVSITDLSQGGRQELEMESKKY